MRMDEVRGRKSGMIGGMTLYLIRLLKQCDHRTYVASSVGVASCCQKEWLDSNTEVHHYTPLALTTLIQMTPLVSKVRYIWAISSDVSGDCAEKHCRKIQVSRRGGKPK